MNDIYEKRKTLIKEATNHIEPSRVPINTSFISWPAAYVGKTLQEFFDDPEMMIKDYTKAVLDSKCDMVITPGVPVPLPALQLLEGGSYFISDDGVSLQHKANCVMKADEYKELAADPIAFMTEKLAPRKYGILAKSREEAKEAIAKAALSYYEHINTLVRLEKNIENEGVIVAAGPGNPGLMDMVFDKLRGFQETIIDMRRHPEELKDAVDKLFEVYGPSAAIALKGGDEIPWAFTPMHSPTFIGRKNFDEFWWPVYTKQIEPLMSEKAKIYIITEGRGMFWYEHLRDYPKSKFVLALDQDDPLEVKNYIGDWATICTGIELNNLKLWNKEQCIDAVKKTIDDLSPGGGFILAPDKALLGKNDFKFENLLTVHEFAIDYSRK